MEEDKTHLLSQLILISKIDSALAGIYAEKKRIDKELSALNASIKQNETEQRSKSLIHDEKKRRYQKEENRLRDERDKLVGRRKALTSLNNYKLQQSAEKEIEQTSRQIGMQEEALLETLDEIDKLAAEVKLIEQNLTSLRESHTKISEDAKQALMNFEERERKYQEERLTLTQKIDPKSLTTYDRVKERFIMDPVVEVIGSQCSGCHMQVGPQIIVQISRGDSLVRCPGCGRIVYLKGSDRA